MPLLISGLEEKWIGVRICCPLKDDRFKESKGQRFKGHRGGQRNGKIRVNVINFTVGEKDKIEHIDEEKNLNLMAKNVNIRFKLGNTKTH